MLESFVQVCRGPALLAFALVGCASSPAATAPSTSTPAAAAANSEACNEIAKACHRHDKEAGVIHDCHELGHAQNLEACLARRQQCLEACGQGH